MCNISYRDFQRFRIEKVDEIIETVQKDEADEQQRSVSCQLVDGPM